MGQMPTYDFCSNQFLAAALTCLTDALAVFATTFALALESLALALATFLTCFLAAAVVFLTSLKSLVMIEVDFFALMSALAFSMALAATFSAVFFLLVATVTLA